MDFAMLGPLLVRHDGRTIEIGARKQRALLIYLLLRVGHTVPVDRLIDVLWEDNPPPQARVTLRSYVSSLRRLLGSAGEGPVIVTRGNGYCLEALPETVDSVRFAALVAQARDAAGQDAASEALLLLDQALSLWHGEALADVAGSAFAVGERTRLEELRLSAHEGRFDALLALGRHREAVAGLESFTADAPLRERAQAQLMRALYRSGRAADALAAFQRYRQTLVDELGLDPSPELQQLAERIVRQEERGQSAIGDADTAGTGSSVPQTAAVHPQPVAASAPEPHRRRVVGRMHERTELRAAVDRVRSGAGGLLLIAGEPGIGKSTLLDELGNVAAGAGLQVAWGRCHETKGAPPFWPWIQVVRGVAGSLTDDRLGKAVQGAAAPVLHLVDDIVNRLGLTPPTMAADLEAARFHLYDALAAFLLTVAHERPLVVVMDDLHWADPPSLEALSFLAPQLAHAPVLVAAAYRDVRSDWAHDLEAALATVVREPTTQQVGLVGLQPDAVAELAEQLTGAALSPEELDMLHQRTDGNPFFVRQLSQLHAEMDGRQFGQAIPSAVTHVIARRLALLPPDVRRLLELASVLGGPFDVRWLVDVPDVDADAILEAAAVAAEQRLIEPVGRSASTYRFVHSLVRETICDGLSPMQAARAHARVADALEGTRQAPASMLAEHFWKAADIVDDDRPVRYLLAAAEEALAVFGHEQAQICLRRALELLGGRQADAALELHVRVRLVQLLVATQGWSAKAVEEVAEPARHLARAAGSRLDLIPLWEALFVQYWSAGNIKVATEMGDQLRAEAESWGHPAAIALSRTAAAELALTLGGDARRAVEDATEAEHLAEQASTLGAETQDIRIAAAQLSALGLALLNQREPAIEAASRSILLARERAKYSHAVAWMVAAYTGMFLGDPDFTADSSATAIALAKEAGYPFVSLMATVFDHWAAARRGGDPVAHAASMEEAIDALGVGGLVDGQAKRLVCTAETYLLADDRAAAWRCLQKARAFTAVNGETLMPERVARIEATVAGSVAPVAGHQ